MSTKQKFVPQNPLILRCHRLMEAFAKSDDERDFYLDRAEGFLIYADLDKSEEELSELHKELKSNPERYVLIPKMTFYEVKKLMEGFVNEKVYDIDTKEKLLDIISSKEARENFLEFIYDHHSELEKWQQYYQERFRVRIIEWLRNNHFDFVFEEDLETTKGTTERLKMATFTAHVAKELAAARKMLVAKAKTYYSLEALNPRPKRGRPPKQVAKVETEPQFSQDIYLSVAKGIKPFLFTPDFQATASIFTFSGKFATEADLLAHKRQQMQNLATIEMQNLSEKLATLRSLSSHWLTMQKGDTKEVAGPQPQPAAPNAPPAQQAPAVPVVSPKARPLPTKPQAVSPQKVKPLSAKRPEVIPQKVRPKPAKLQPKKAKPQPKARLRPLVKQKAPPPPARPKPQPKKKTALRRLRPSNKKK
jgi:hypothetical protein